MVSEMAAASPSRTEVRSVEGNVYVAGDRIRYRIDGDGPPIVLLHGLGAALELWEPVVPRLEGFRVIRLDHPGSGRSSDPRALPSVADYAATALGALECLDVDSAAVAGLSFGGMVAQEMAHLAGHRVARLVLVNTCCGWGSVPGSPLALAAVATPLRYYSPAFMGLVAPLLYGGRGDGHVLTQQAEARQTNPPSLLGYGAQLAAAWTWSSRRYLRHLDVPTLVVAGDRDPVIPVENAAMLARAIPGARRHVVAQGGHLCMIDSADQTVPVITAFLRETGYASYASVDSAVGGRR